jgi:hypothetical protein
MYDRPQFAGVAPVSFVNHRRTGRKARRLHKKVCEPLTTPAIRPSSVLMRTGLQTRGEANQRRSEGEGGVEVRCHIHSGITTLRYKSRRSRYRQVLSSFLGDTSSSTKQA